MLSANFLCLAGGGEYTVGSDAHGTPTAYFSNCADQRLYAQPLAAATAASSAAEPPLTPRALTATDVGLRFADGEVDGARGRLVCVVEDHSGGGEAVSSVGAVGE